MIITKEFKIQLKKSNAIIFRFNGDYLKIELHKDNSYTTIEEKHLMRCPCNAIFHEFIYNWDNVIQGNIGLLLSLCRNGDRVEFHYRTNNSDLLRDAALFNDELCMSIWRKDKKIANDIVIIQQTSKNNSARPVKV